MCVIARTSSPAAIALCGLLSVVYAHSKQNQGSALALAELDVLTLVVDFAVDTSCLQAWITDEDY